MNKFKKIACMLAMLSATTLVKADSLGVFVGVTYNFGGAGPGVTVNVTNTTNNNTATVGAGLTYYPANNSFGANAALGYNYNNGGVIAGYDFIQNGLIVGGGYINTSNDSNTPVSNNEEQAPD